MFDSAEVRRLITPTSYCWPIIDLNELHESSIQMRSRSQSDSNPETSPPALADLVDQYLGQVVSGDSACLTREDDTGHRIMFIHLLAPLPLERRRKLAVLEEAVREKPLFLAVLFPEMACDISEVELAYQFSAKDILEEHFGAEIEFNIYHQGCTFTNLQGVFHVLLHQHPSLLIGLSQAFTVLPEVSQSSVAVSQVLRLARDSLRQLNERIIDNVYVEPLVISLENVSVARITIIDECQAVINHFLPGNSEEPLQNNTLTEMLREAFTLILSDEREAFEHQMSRIAPNVMEEEDMDITPRDDEGQSVVGVFSRMFRLNRIVARRLNRLALAFPLE